MKAQRPDWFVIADAARARVVSKMEGEPMALVQVFDHPDSRKRSHELASDRPGREQSDRSFGGASFEPRVDAHRKEHLRFAQEIAHWLEHEARENGFGWVSLYAPNPFLGELRQMLGSSCVHRLAGVHEIDLSRVGIVELPARLQELGAPAH